MRQTLTNDFWGLHKNMNCPFPLKVADTYRNVKKNDKVARDCCNEFSKIYLLGRSPRVLIQMNHFFCSATCSEEMKKFNCQKIAHCLCFTRNRRSY